MPRTATGNAGIFAVPIWASAAYESFLSLFAKPDPHGIDAALRRRKSLRKQGYARIYRATRKSGQPAGGLRPEPLRVSALAGAHQAQGARA